MSTPIDPVVPCPTCHSPLRVGDGIDRLDERCPVCRAEVWMSIFPRLHRSQPRDARSRVGSEGEARCSFYPELAAEKVCDECGCLLSEKAAARWGDEDFCLPCLHRLREEKGSMRFVARAKLTDNRALALVTLLAPFTLFTAPVALVLLWKHRGDTRRFESRSSWRWWVALILALFWLVLWITLGVVWTSLAIEDLM